MTCKRMIRRAALAILAVSAAIPASGKRPLQAEDDPREAITLTPAETAHLLAGMRIYLESIQGIVAAMAENDVSRVPKLAEKSGARLMHGASPATGVKLPPGFMMMSFDTHDKFDKLAEKTRRGSSRSEVLVDLRDILGNCISCHSAYRLAP